jgi:hypothetical protein
VLHCTNLSEIILTRSRPLRIPFRCRGKKSEMWSRFVYIANRFTVLNLRQALTVWHLKNDKWSEKLTDFSAQMSYKVCNFSIQGHNKMCLWNTNAPQSDKFHWKPCLHQSFWKIGQMLSRDGVIVICNRNQL